MRNYRFRPPRWRHFRPLFDEELEFSPFFPAQLILALVSAFLTVLVLPLIALVVEAPTEIARGLFSDVRWVDATCAELPRSQRTWRTDSVHLDAVVDQVTRQLGLGYERIDPHNAVFEGFSDT